MNNLFEKICNLLTEENTETSLGIKNEIEAFRSSQNINVAPNRATPSLSDEIVTLLKVSEHILAKQLIEAQKWLVWRKTTIPATLISEEISNLFYVCPIMGLDTYIPSKRFRLGFLYQKPNCYYPLHNHNAVETYAVIGGALDWSDGKEHRKLTVGDFVHHPSLLPHAFKTRSLGFLGLWHWSGDISPDSYKVLE
mgnify:FL=1